MTDKLKISIEKLYDIFGKYQGLSKLEGSPNYGDLDSWNKQLRSKNLRELTDEDLSRFAGKVISTWGDENDFRFYLPRILELTAHLKTPYDIWILYSKFEDANWKSWDDKEQRAINDFTLELWNNLLNDDSEKAEGEFNDYFSAFAYYFHDFARILNVWESNDSFASIKHLANYIYNEQINLFHHNYISGIEKNTKHIEQFKKWLTSDKILTKIENSFYQNEESEIAERLSWLEQMLTYVKKYST